jgi:antitoxin (DNA-binding transcriptional repressor) of toxin-antitoxin stability system
MKRANTRQLHLNTSDILKQVAGGETYVIERRGVPVAELRPYHADLEVRPLPDREDLIAGLPAVKTDSGRLLEEERS